MKSRYCYWSVCDGAYGTLMENCVRTARAAGVFQEFHVLTDRPLAGCECYDAFTVDKTNGLFKLHYLKVGMSRLNFEWFIWLDADTVFVRKPVDALAPLGSSPVHVPLEFNLSALAEDVEWKGMRLFAVRDLMRRWGVVNRVYLSGSAFWIVHHEAIEPVYDLTMGLWHKGKEAGTVLDVSAALGYAMQLLCADPEGHLLSAQPEVWAGDEGGQFGGRPPDGLSWEWRHPLGGEAVTVRPAIIHRPLATRAGRPAPAGCERQ